MRRKMADKEGARFFCSACGEKFMGNDRYCIKWGEDMEFPGVSKT